jgi:MFS family permease
MSPSPTGFPTEESQPRRYWRLVVGMAAVYSLLFIMAQMHRMGGAVVAPSIAAELSLSASDLGLIIGAMFLASAAMQPVSGILLDRFGTVRAVVMLLPLAVFGMLLFAWGESVLSLTIGRALIGAGFACTVSGLYIFLLSWVKRENFTMATTLVLAVPGTIAVLLASTPLALLLEELGRGYLFTALAAASIVVVGAVSLMVKEGPRSTRLNRAPQTLRQSIGGTLMIVQQKRFLWIAAYGLTALGPSYSIIGLLSGVYLQERFGLDTITLGNTLFALFIALNLGGAMYGPLDRFVGRRQLVVASGITTQIILILTLCAMPMLGYWGTAGLLVAFASFSQVQPLVIAQAQSLFAPELSGRVITTSNIFMVGGIFVFQAASGRAYDYFTQTLGLSPVDGYRLTFLVLAACQAIGLLFYLRAPAPNVDKNT